MDEAALLRRKEGWGSGRVLGTRESARNRQRHLVSAAVRKKRDGQRCK